MTQPLTQRGESERRCEAKVKKTQNKKINYRLEKLQQLLVSGKLCEINSEDERTHIHLHAYLKLLYMNSANPCCIVIPTAVFSLDVQ